MKSVPKATSRSSQAEQEISWVRLPGNHIGFVQREWNEALARAGLQTADHFFSAVGEPLSKPGLGKRYRARLSIDGQQLYLKRYDGDTLTGLLTRWYEDGKQTTTAEREANVAIGLMEQGIGACIPAAYGHSRNFGTAQKSFIVTAAAPGVSLETFVESKSQISWNEKLRLIQAVALLARQFHENGWRHRDFYLCHIFIRKIEEQIQLTLIDLARVFRPRWRRERWLIKDLAQLNYSAPQRVFSRTARLRFALEYFRCKKLNHMQKTLLREVLKKTESISRHDRNRS